MVTMPVFAVVPMFSAPFAKPLSMPNVPDVGPVTVAPRIDSVPPTTVLPVAAAVVNLPALTFTSPAIAVLPVSAVTTNFDAPTVRSPVTPRVWAIVAMPLIAVVWPD